MQYPLRHLKTENVADRTQLISSVLKRGGFDDLWEGEISSRNSSPGPEDAPQFDLSNLARLRQIYSAFNAAHQHSQWREEYVASELNLNRFRGDSAYMWQYRDGNLPVTYLATYYWLKNSGVKDLLAKCSEDGAFGAFCVETDAELVSRDRLDSVCQLGFLRNCLGMNERSTLSLLDIGSGYGRLAWRLGQTFPYTHCLCADAIPESTFLCEYYIRFRNVTATATAIELPDLDYILAKTRVDCALAINSLTECSAQSVRWWLQRLSDHNIDLLFIVPDGNHRRGLELRTVEEHGIRSLNMKPILSDYGFRPVTKLPKYTDSALLKYGVSPTTYHLYVRK